VQVPGATILSGRKFAADEAERVDQTARVAMLVACEGAAGEAEGIDRKARAAILVACEVAADEAEGIDQTARAVIRPVRVSAAGEAEWAQSDSKQEGVSLERSLSLPRAVCCKYWSEGVDQTARAAIQPIRVSAAGQAEWVQSCLKQEGV